MVNIANDTGNSHDKWFNSDFNIGGCFITAVAPLDKSEWDYGVSSNGGHIPQGYIQVNRGYYAVGQAAGSLKKSYPQGGKRYTRDYYGVLMIYAYTQFLDAAMSKGHLTRIPEQVNLMGLLPPRDIREWRKTLLGLLQDTYHVVTSEYDFTFRANTVNAFPEPIAGYANFRYTRWLEERQDVKLNGANIVIGDLGGFTFDLGFVNADNQVDKGRLKSSTIGVIAILEKLEERLREKYKGEFSAQPLPRERLERTLMTGAYPMGREDMPAQDIVKKLLTTLGNDVIQEINKIGGMDDTDVILLTGGGANLILDRVAEEYPRAYVYLTDTPENVQMSNAKGAAKLLQGIIHDKK